MAINNPITNLQLDLLDKRIIDLTGMIDTAMATYVRYAVTILMARDCPPIDVWFTSGGGEVIAGLDIYDLLEIYPGKITGKVIGVAESMAVIILQACDVRKATRHAKFMVHNPYIANVSYDSFHNQEKLELIIADNAKQRELIIAILTERTGLSKEKTEELLDAAEIMTADQAWSKQLIDGFIADNALNPQP